MRLVSRVFDLPPFSELGRQALRVVSAHIQAAAVFRPIRREGRNDDRPAGRHRTGHGSHVLLTLRGLEQKVEERAIVPDVVCAETIDCQHVADDPSNPVCVTAQPRSGAFDRVAGDVDDGHLAISVREKMIDES